MIDYMVILIGLAALVSTLLGGLFALRYQDKLHLILGFSAGAVIGVAFFDLLPEALHLTQNYFEIGVVTAIIASGFVVYMIFDRIFVTRLHEENECGNIHHHGRLGAGSLSIHSFLDGVAVGLAFQVSTQVGLIVTVAVLAHDFSDGINTVSLILKSSGNKKEAFQWLVLDAVAPLLGVLTTFLFKPAPYVLGLVLSIFCGFFLYIGASELLPESHHQHPTLWTTFATVAGIAVLYAVIKLAGA